MPMSQHACRRMLRSTDEGVEVWALALALSLKQYRQCWQLHSLEP